ncbi:MAG TPA: hypothetical protein VFD51_01650 [Patescibacteria group bacterium]|nr:hypothetical protein [Patescibacteria group bacterium]
MNEQSKEMTQPVKKRLSDEAFEKLIQETTSIPVSDGYASKCYCRRCGLSWDMRVKGLQILRKENLASPFKIPKGISDPMDEKGLKKCYFILEPCFACRNSGEKIKTEVCLISKQLTKKSVVKWQNTFAPSNRKK